MRKDAVEVEPIFKTSKACKRDAEGISTTRGATSEASIRKSFDELLLYLKKQKQEGVLLHPNRIFNGDETSFHLY